MSGFRKGDAVTYLSNWDSKGTVTVRDLIVHSCGKKQMILVNEAGEKFQGQFFQPDGTGYGPFARVVHRLSPAEAEAAGLAMAAEIIAYQHAHYDDRLQRWGDNPRFAAAMHAESAQLHEPRVLRKEG